jgi:hypothetical protein
LSMISGRATSLARRKTRVHPRDPRARFSGMMRYIGW